MGIVYSETLDKHFVHVKQAELPGLCFTILDIKKKFVTDNEFHTFVWDLYVDMNGQYYLFTMNPSKRRDVKLARLKERLPVADMMLVEKEFFNESTYEVAIYYELELHREK